MQLGLRAIIICWQQKFSFFLSSSLFLILVLLSFSVLLHQFPGLLRHSRVSFISFCVSFVIPVSPSSVSVSPSLFPCLLHQFLCLLRHPRVSFISFCVSFVIPVSPSSVSVSPSSSPCLLHQFLCLLRYSRASFVIPSSSSLSSCLLRHPRFKFFFVIPAPFFIVIPASIYFRHSRIYLFSSFPRRRESSTVHKSISHFPINEPTLALVCDRSITIVKY